MVLYWAETRSCLTQLARTFTFPLGMAHLTSTSLNGEETAVRPLARGEERRGATSGFLQLPQQDPELGPWSL